MCVRTFVQQAKIMTGREFVKEVENGQKHHALSDCRTQIRYLVNARTALLPQPMERTLPSPEISFSIENVNVEKILKRTLPSLKTSFSSADVDVEEALNSATSSFDPFEETLSEHEAFLEIIVSSHEVEREAINEDALMSQERAGIMLPSPETSFSLAEGNIEQTVERTLPTPETSFSTVDVDVEEALRSAASSLLRPPPTEKGALLEKSPSNGEAEMEAVNEIPMTARSSIGTDGQDLDTNTQTQSSASDTLSGHRVRNPPYKVVKKASNGSLTRRNAQVKTPRQLLTPETSFNAEEYEKE